MRTDKNGMPYRKAFAFGQHECAICGEKVESCRKIVTLKVPVYADYAETEILIPAGQQAFHRECWLAYAYPSLKLG